MSMPFQSVNEEWVIIKAYFKDLVATLWVDDHHIANRTKCDEIGTMLWTLSASLLLHFEFYEGKLSCH